MMEKTSSRRSPSRLATFVVFLLLAVEVGGADDPNGASTQFKPEPSVSGRVVKKLDGIDYDSFVGLMGRRNAAEANSPRDAPATGNGRLARFLTALLRDETRVSCCARDNNHSRGALATGETDARQTRDRRETDARQTRDT